MSMQDELDQAEVGTILTTSTVTFRDSDSRVKVWRKLPTGRWAAHIPGISPTANGLQSKTLAHGFQKEVWSLS